MKSKFLHFFSNYRWARQKLGGLWTYYQTSLPMTAVWVRRESRNEKLSCLWSESWIIKEEDYRLEELYKSYE